MLAQNKPESRKCNVSALNFPMGWPSRGSDAKHRAKHEKKSQHASRASPSRPSQRQRCWRCQTCTQLLPRTPQAALTLPADATCSAASARGVSANAWLVFTVMGRCTHSQITSLQCSHTFTVHEVIQCSDTARRFSSRCS